MDIWQIDIEIFTKRVCYSDRHTYEYVDRKVEISMDTKKNMTFYKDNCFSLLLFSHLVFRIKSECI